MTKQQHRFRKAPPPVRDPKRYGWQHQKARNAAKLLHDPSHPCARCKRPLGPMGSWLHYDHAADGIHYLGFSHGNCNRDEGARKGNAAQRRGNPPPSTRTTSRDWFGPSPERKLPEW